MMMEQPTLFTLVEENYTLYISKLNDTYTDVVGWHKDGKEERDEEYKAEYGVDYIRLFPGAHREAPAMFKYQRKVLFDYIGSYWLGSKSS